MSKSNSDTEICVFDLSLLDRVLCKKLAENYFKTFLKNIKSSTVTLQASLLEKKELNWL